MAVEAGRGRALGLVVAAVVIAAVSVLASVDGGPGRGGHVHLWPLSHPFAGVAIAGGLVAVAARFGVRGGRLRTGTQIAAVLVAVAALGLGVLAGWFGGGRPAPSVVATSPDLQVVSYRIPTLILSDDVVLRLRTREGLGRRGLGGWSWAGPARPGSGPVLR